MIDSNLLSSRQRLVGRQDPEATLSPAVPATPDGDVGASCPKPAVLRGPVSAPLNDDPTFLDTSVPHPLPLPSVSPNALPSPLQENQPDLSLSFAGVLPPTDVSLPTPPIVRAAQNLRLPSFDLLGIAAPHPDRIPLRSNLSFSSLGAGPLSKPEDPLHALSPSLDRSHQADRAAAPFANGPEAAKAQVEHIVPIVTPPSEPGTFNWGAFVNVKTVGVGSPPNSEPGVSPNLNTTAGALSLGPAPTVVVPASTELSDAVRMAAWVQIVKDIITTESGCLDLNSVRVLSHALPCPSLTGHLFGQLIAAIHDRTTTYTAWINVFHAVPGRFTLEDLPKSPPSTPGPAVGGDEYFTSKIFDSAVAIPDYQLDSKLLPPSPRPVVPPGSVNISVVERYIPPTNTNEFAEIFRLKGRSLLYDRLVELSFENGLLLFIYPTKTGARTFMQDYLGPILDPLLRSITVVHNLSSDLGKSLGHMSAVDHLDEYPHLKTQLEKFCEALTRNVSTSQVSGDRRPIYEVIYASKEEVSLNRKAWADDWWIKQEKTRVREVVTRYFRRTKRLPTETELTSSYLIQEVLDGVSAKEYEGHPPRNGVQVGVFIIKKTMA